MTHQFMATLAELDAESAENLTWRSIPWRDQVVCFGGGREVNPDGDGACGVSRQRLVSVLTGRARELGVEIRYEHEVSDVAALPEADLIVLADGGCGQFGMDGEFGSKVTEQRNEYIWLGTGKEFDSFTFIFEPTEVGWIWAYAYQHEPMTSTFIVECEPGTWAGLGFDHCSPGRMLDRLEEIFAAHLGGRRLWTQFNDGTESQWQRFAAVSNERWHHGNVVLVGDAAHTTHFSASFGTALAMQDAMALADQLSRAASRAAGDAPAADLSAALTAYQRQRQAELRLPATQAALSALWFENVPRYADLTPRQFATALHARCAPLLPKLPPRLFCLLHDVARRLGVTVG